MYEKLYKGTIETLLENDTFVSEFLQGIRNRDLSRLIDEGIYAKLFIADAYRKELRSNSNASGKEGLDSGIRR